MKVPIEEVSGRVLDYLIARALWPERDVPAWWFTDRPDGCLLPSLDGDSANPVDGFFPQSSWGQSGPVLAQYDIYPFVWEHWEGAYGAQLPRPVERLGQSVRFRVTGPTPLVAAWRCLVAFKLGRYTPHGGIVVDVPQEAWAQLQNKD